MEAGELACRDVCRPAPADREEMAELKDDIRAFMLPRTEEHCRALKQLGTRRGRLLLHSTGAERAATTLPCR